MTLTSCPHIHTGVLPETSLTVSQSPEAERYEQGLQDREIGTPNPVLGS